MNMVITFKFHKIPGISWFVKNLLTEFPHKNSLNRQGKKNFIKGETYKGNVKTGFIFWIHFCILITKNTYVLPGQLGYTVPSVLRKNS
jgi:hypothetical protein